MKLRDFIAMRNENVNLYDVLVFDISGRELGYEPNEYMDEEVYTIYPSSHCCLNVVLTMLLNDEDEDDDFDDDLYDLDDIDEDEEDEDEE